MKKGLKIFLIIVVIGIVGGLGTVYYVFNKPHRDVEGEKPAFILDAETLFNEYNLDEEAGNIKYGDKILQVSGNIVDVTSEKFEVSITLSDEMEGVNCSLDSIAIVEYKNKIESLKEGDSITIKGKCDGFDMIMGVVLTRCYIVKE